ncbi:hypothetical protein I4U23_022594 [Adineta vaga]|nr:hypothetical protein I4U23_022594 [Adineta vaga]
MNCMEIFQEKNYSLLILNQAFSDDSGSWWWWINIIGTLLFGFIGLIGNIICLFVVYRFPLSSHSFVEYLRVLSLFDFLTLFYEVIQSLNDLLKYLFLKTFLNLSSSILCKFYEYFKYTIILLSCWIIVLLTIDRYILVCKPFSKTFPKLSQKFCNSKCAKRFIFLIILLSLLINIPHLIFKEWYCRPNNYQHSVIFYQKYSLNQTNFQDICSCRISQKLQRNKMKFFIIWHHYIFHLFFYTIIPSIILITSYKNHCNIHLILTFRILKRLTELLNICALGINFFLYILGVNHYRSSTIRMLGLHHYHMFSKYLIIEHKNFQTFNQNIDSTKMKFLKTNSTSFME